MPIFGHHHHRSERWHLDIDSYSEVGGKKIDLKEYNPEKQPWSRMRQSTDRYLSKKKDAKVAKSRDELLRKLILGHSRKDVAIVACGHAMSTNALEDLLLSDALSTLNSLGDFKVLLQCIHAASLVNEVVNTEEGLEAVELLKRDYSESCSYLRHLLDILVAYPTSQSVACLRVHTAVSIELEVLKLELENLRTERRWSQAQSVVKVLSSFEENSNKSSNGYQKVKSLLDSDFPTWLAWARWRPNLDRIVTWNKLDDQQCKKLGKILDLDGPDFDCDGKTYGESLANHLLLPHRDTLPQRINGSTLDECRDMAERLLCLLENIVTHHPDDMPLFHHAITGTDIMKRNLVLLEKLICGDFGTISITVAEAYSLRGATPEMQAEAVKRLLRLLNTERFHDLRDAFAVDFAALMTDLIREERDHLIRAIRKTRTSEDSFASYALLHSDLQKASWLWPFLEEALPNLMDDWPSTKDLATLKDIYFTLHIVPTKTSSSVMDLISCYVLENPGYLNMGIRGLAKSLIRLWQQVHDPIRRFIALSVVPGAASVTEVRCACIEQLSALSDTFVQSFWNIICCCDEGGNPEESCIAMAKLLAEASLSVDMAHWRPVLHRMIVEQGDKLFEYALRGLVMEEWIQFLADIQLLYGTSQNWDSSRSPAVLKPGLLEWSRKFLSYSKLIELLKVRLDPIAIRCLFFGPIGRINSPDAFLRILEAVRHYPPGAEEKFSLQVSILNRLSQNGHNADEVYNALTALNKLSRNGFEAFTRIQYWKNSSHFVTKTFIEAWLRDPSINEDDARELKIIFMHSDTDIRQGWVDEKELALAADHLDLEYAELLDEARRLAALRGSLKTVDLQGVAELLESIDIEDCTTVEDALASLPAEVVNAVEIVGEKEVEILFPLTHLTQLQRTALGVGTSQSFVLLLEVCDHKAKPGRFCIHFDTESKSNDYGRTLDGLLKALDEASPWANSCRLGGQTSLHSCREYSSPFKYHLDRYLQRQLITNNLGKDFTSLAELHTIITHYLKNIGKSCSICGKIYLVNLRKPTPCTSQTCSSLFQKSHLPVRISDLIQDPLAIDLLLSSVSAAASTGNLSLLPNLPTSVKHPSEIVGLLDALPPLTSSSAKAQARIKDGQSYNALSSHLLTLSRTEDLISYILNSHRSFLTTATGRLKIPSMPPGTLQFVLANSSPEREAAFAAEIDLRPEDSETRILFHGTSPDRLFAILCSGLKILSETPLEAHGAVHGRGIYMADEPSTSYLYCSKTLEKNWKNSALEAGKAYKILLGCEQAGPRLVMGEDVIHVVRNERTLMLRYVFLIPSQTQTVPVARHLVPGMGSVAKGLRSGAL